MDTEKIIKDLTDYRAAGTNDKFKTERWITIEEATILHELLIDNNIVNYFECGTANGFSACWASLAAKVDTWDPHDRPKLYNEAEFAQLRSKITFHNCKYNDTIKETSPSRGDERALFFIDGDHKMRPARNDINNTLRCAQPGDIIVLHDVLGYDWLQGRVQEFLKSHKAEINLLNAVWALFTYK